MSNETDLEARARRELTRLIDGIDVDEPLPASESRAAASSRTIIAAVAVLVLVAGGAFAAGAASRSPSADVTTAADGGPDAAGPPDENEAGVLTCVISWDHEQNVTVEGTTSADVVGVRVAFTRYEGVEGPWPADPWVTENDDERDRLLSRLEPVDSGEVAVATTPLEQSDGRTFVAELPEGVGDTYTRLKIVGVDEDGDELWNAPSRCIVPSPIDIELPDLPAEERYRRELCQPSSCEMSGDLQEAT